MAEPLDLYVCPKCRGKLRRQTRGFHCDGCRRDYPLDSDIPDFLPARPRENAHPYVTTGFYKLGKLVAPIYENLWYAVSLKLLGGWDAPSQKDIVKNIRERMSSVDGLVLDVATGTGTYGRHIAGAGRTVYGIDISREMLRKGQDYIKRESVQNIHFARADAESLPFDDRVFDGCLVCGSLHAFPDTLKVLREIGRTLKPGARVIVTTLIHGDKGIFKRTPSGPKLKIFDIPDLQKIVDEAGFERFEPQAHGCLLLFTMRKR